LKSLVQRIFFVFNNVKKIGVKTTIIYNNCAQLAQRTIDVCVQLMYVGKSL